MKTRQKALVVAIDSGKIQGLDELNTALGRGWRVVQVSPMGGAGAGAQDAPSALCLASLVIIERGNGEMALLEAEEETEELINEIVEGDGSSVDIEDPGSR